VQLRLTTLASIAMLVAALVVRPFTGGADDLPFHVAGIAGFQGDNRVAHQAGDTFEYSEDLAIEFSQPVDVESFKAGYAIAPQTPSSVYPIDYGRTMRLTIRKVPGVSYSVSISAGVRSRDGAALGRDFVVRFTTPAGVDIPKPARATPGEPYRYGALEHPFPFSLSGPVADKQIDLLARARVRFVRIDYCGSQIESNPGRYDWSVEDGILEKLARRGITELPVVDQYCAPTWATGGHGYPAIWQDPSDYAAFAGAIAAHVAMKSPAIGRIELFNEPNLHGWWQNPNPLYAARDGSATSAYMSAAYAAVKRAHPRLLVVGPALADGGNDTDPRKFLTTMYDSGCARGRCWDVLSVHNYRWFNPTFHTNASDQNRWDIYRTLQQIAAAHGDAGTHIMLTEWGFSTAQQSPEGLDPAVQARYVALGLNLMLADPTVDGIVYVNVYNPAQDFWGRTSLTNGDFSTLPAFDVLRAFSAGANVERGARSPAHRSQRLARSTNV